MADLERFERVFRAEVQRKKDANEPLPSWGDVKKFVKSNQLFDEDEMGDSDFKARLKELATKIAVEAVSNDTEDKEPSNTKVAKSGSKKRKPAEDAEEEHPPAKKAKKEQKLSVKEKVGPSKSQAVIDSDEEEEPEAKFKPSKPGNRKAKPVDSDSDNNSDPKPPKTPEAGSLSPPGKKGRAPAAAVVELSDSDLSVLDNNSPVKPKKTKGEPKKKRASKQTDAPKEKKSKGKGKSDVPADSNEEQVKRLKSFVVACGVRKKWAKEFEGIEDNPKKQISRLKEILEGLGMTGRLSMEKAKQIKAQREFAEELEDIKQFDARRGVAKEEKSKRPQKKHDPEPSSGDEEEVVTRSSAPKRKTNPLAFLDVQSDEE